MCPQTLPPVSGVSAAATKCRPCYSSASSKAALINRIECNPPSLAVHNLGLCPAIYEESMYMCRW